jgi:hypothetical protein
MVTLAVILRPISGSTKQHVTVSHALSRLQDTVLPRIGRSVDVFLKLEDISQSSLISGLGPSMRDD